MIVHGPPLWLQRPVWPLARMPVRSAGLPDRHHESSTSVPWEREMSMPWLQETLLQRMHAM